jgi:hypothetical protein
LQRGRQRRNDISQAACFRKRRGLGRDHQDAGHRGIVARAAAMPPVLRSVRETVRHCTQRASRYGLDMIP